MEERIAQAYPIARRPIQRGAAGQTAALKDLPARMASINAADDERNWEAVKRGLQETRRAQGQRLLFPE